MKGKRGGEVRTGKSGYMPQLDGLRAIAVSLVLIAHLAPKGGIFPSGILYGRVGVLTFFVLSGYLITGILLKTKGRDIHDTLRSFYARRFLRIFPIYYMSLIVLFVLSPWFRTIAPWHIFYATNCGIAFTDIDFKWTSHLWSLAVEEQFYLVWPMMVLLTPMRRLKPLMIGMILTSVGIKAWGSRNGAITFPSTLPLWANFDALCAGGLMALSQHKNKPITFSPTIALLCLPVFLDRYLTLGRPLDYVIQDAAIITFAAWIVGGAAMGFRGVGGKALSSRPMVYVGKISYGVYLYHWFIYGLLPDAGFLAVTTLTVLIASLSWRWVECPIMAMKDRFSYIHETHHPPPRCVDKNTGSTPATVLSED